MHPDWTLRVPVLRPRGIAWLDAAVMAVVLAAVFLALYRQSASLPLAVAAAAAVAGLRALAALRAGPGVRAIRVDRDGAFYLRMPDGWRPATWVGAWRGPRWLTLRAALPADVCNGSSSRQRDIAVTVWQDGLPGPAWRRVCLLANRRLCRAPAVARAAGTS